MLTLLLIKFGVLPPDDYEIFHEKNPIGQDTLPYDSR